MKNTTALKIVPTNLESVARSYKMLMDQAKAIEQKIAPYRTILEVAGLKAGGTLDLDNVRLVVSESSRESIAVKAAKDKLGRLLTPFLKTTTFNVVHVIDRKAA